MQTIIFGHSVTAWQLLASLGIIMMAFEVFVPGFIMLPIGIALLLTSGASLFVTGWLPLLFILGFNLLVVFIYIKKVLKLKIAKSDYSTNTDNMVGQEVEVTEDINEGQSGYVKLYGDRWQATLDMGSASTGDKLKIVQVDGNKVVVSKQN